MIDGAPDDRSSTRRLAFLAALERYGLASEFVTGGAPHTVAGGKAAMAELLGHHPGITAVVGFNDLIAIGAIGWPGPGACGFRTTWRCWGSTG